MQRMLNTILIISITTQIIIAQNEIIIFDENHPCANVLAYEQENTNQPKSKKYPVTGNYTPTEYSNGPLGIESNTGFSDYVYIPTKGQLEVGKQYSLTLTIKFDSSYDQMSYFQDNFGLALTSYLYPNKFPTHWGLWNHTFEPLEIQHGGQRITIEREFRPLCESKYIVLGVFQDDDQDPLSCFNCKYPFEIYSLTVTKSTKPEVECSYLCDEFKENRQINIHQKEANIYFESGSAEIDHSYNELLDSVTSQTNSTDNILVLSAFTDVKGSDNERLGNARNESVRGALISRGINRSKIIEINYSDTKSAEIVLSSDRRVEIGVMFGESYKQHYTAAVEASKNGDFLKAQKEMLDGWIENIPAKYAIYATFDCWGESMKAKKFKSKLVKEIKSKFYSGNNLRYKLDSLHCEWMKGRYLIGNLYLMRLPGTNLDCKFNSDLKRNSMLREEIDALYIDIGFPKRKDVGNRGNNLFINIILTSDNLEYLERYLPLVRSACERGILSWKSYARIFDQISIMKYGYQRYGTKMKIDETEQLIASFPFEDESKIDEYRKQVKLAPFTRSVKSAIQNDQDKLDMELVTMLNEIYTSDQHYRNQISQENRNFKKWKETDSLNLIKVRKILDEKGWLGPDIISPRGNSTLFLVLQHAADPETQLEYLPMMRSAAERGDANRTELAFLEDRVSLSLYGVQIYGTQIHKDKTGKYFVPPIKNPELLNQRRAKLGLRNMEDYVSRWEIEWNKSKN